MKKITKYFMAAVMMMGAMSFVACSKDDDKNTDEPQPVAASETFDILYMGRELEPGQMVYYNLTAEEVAGDDVEVSLYVKNKSNAAVQRVFKVELAEGPSSMGVDVPICYGVCESQTCPYTSPAVELAAGVADETPIMIHLYPSFHEGAHTGTYKVTVGNGVNLGDPQVCYVKFTW